MKTQARGQMVALMGIGGGDVQFLDIAFPIGTGMLFVTKFVEAVFLCPMGIAVLTRCGLAADLSFKNNGLDKHYGCGNISPRDGDRLAIRHQEKQQSYRL